MDGKRLRFDHDIMSILLYGEPLEPQRLRPDHPMAGIASPSITDKNDNRIGRIFIAGTGADPDENDFAKQIWEL